MTETRYRTIYCSCSNSVLYVASGLADIEPQVIAVAPCHRAFYQLRLVLYESGQIWMKIATWLVCGGIQPWGSNSSFREMGWKLWAWRDAFWSGGFYSELWVLKLQNLSFLWINNWSFLYRCFYICRFVISWALCDPINRVVWVKGHGQGYTNLIPAPRCTFPELNTTSPICYFFSWECWPKQYHMHSR